MMSAIAEALVWLFTAVTDLPNVHDDSAHRFPERTGCVADVPSHVWSEGPESS
jgi:hypothetical protein